MQLFRHPGAKHGEPRLDLEVPTMQQGMPIGRKGALGDWEEEITKIISEKLGSQEIARAVLVGAR